jgi:hypothetical protein
MVELLTTQVVAAVALLQPVQTEPLAAVMEETALHLLFLVHP